jgi:hypothetical protein
VPDFPADFPADFRAPLERASLFPSLFPSLFSRRSFPSSFPRRTSTKLNMRTGGLPTASPLLRGSTTAKLPADMG